jgi:maltose-binding protein MalE
MKKLLVLILAAAMLITSFVACTPVEEKPDDPKESSSETPSEGADPTEPESTVDLGIPEDLNYGEKEVYIFHWESYNPEFVSDEDSMAGDPIHDAIYKKNIYTEQKLNVKLDFTSTLGDGGNMQAFADALKNRMSDPSTPVDIAAAYGRTTALVAVNGLMSDMSVYENLDLSKDWWPKYIQDEFDINGRLYFVSGDISTNLLLMMYGVYYNETLIQSYGLEDPVDLVRNDEWTMDKFMEMSSGVYEDRDGVSGESEGDFYGLACAYFDIDALYHGAGFDLVVKATDGENIVKYADELFTDIAGSFIDKLTAWVKLKEIAMESNINHGDAFKEGRSIFKIDAASAGFGLRDTDIDYRAVPIPKRDPAVQKDFVTCLANPYSLYGIPTSSIDPECAAATMQVLGYYAKELTTPAVFDVTLKGKFSKDESMMEMWELMRKGISFDLGRVYHSQLGYLCDFVSQAVSNGVLWANATNPLALKGKEKSMRGLNSTLKTLIGE